MRTPAQNRSVYRMRFLGGAISTDPKASWDSALLFGKYELHSQQPAQEATLLDYLHEVEHAEARIARLNLAIVEALKLTPPKKREKKNS
jgi:hypothetical protein